MQNSDLDIVYNAINVFYSGQNNSEASEWLNKFQKSVEAWTICDRILGERKDPLACCFAAQTLRQKILKHLKEVPSESYESLRESLINHLSHIHVVAQDQVSDATATQLCLSVADLYIQVPEWNNFIASLLNRFTALEGDRTRMLLTLLRVFPEEVENSNVGENRRQSIREELALSGGSMISYLSNVLLSNTSDTDIIKKVLLCLSALLQNPHVQTDQLAQSPLLTSVFQILATNTLASSVHDAATECIVSAMIRAEDIYAHRSFAIALHQNTFNLQTAFNTAVAEEDLLRLQNFARVFVELCESLLEPVVNQDKDASPLHDLNVLELLLLLAGHHDYSLIEMTFNVWYRISEGLFMIDDDDHVALFKPYVNRYLHALYRHCRFEPDETDIPDGEFMDFRLKVSETIKDVSFIVGSDDVIRMMFDVMKQCAVNNASWDETESALFIASNVIHNLMPDEDSIVPELVKQLITIPVNSNPALIQTSIQFMGGCAEWLGKHDTMQSGVMNWLLSFIDRPEFADCVGESIEKICGQAPLINFIPLLMQAIQKLQLAPKSGKNVEKACQDITKAIAQLLNHLPAAEFSARLKELCEPIMMRLKLVLETDVIPSVDENRGDAWMQMQHRPVIWLDRIAVIFREIKPWRGEKNTANPPWMEAAHTVWDVISGVIRKYDAHGRIMEHACRAIRHVVRALGIQSCRFVGPLGLQLITIYQRHQHSCILYLSSILVDEYGSLEELRPGLLEMLTVLSKYSFPLLQKENGFRDNPDTVDDLFRLASRYITRCPSFYFVHPVSSPLFECAIAGLSIDHNEANRSITKFFNEILNQLISARRSNYYDEGVKAAHDLVQQHGARLIESALRSALFDISSHLRRDMAEIIQLVGKFDKQLQSQYLLHAISTLPRGPLCATDQQLQAFHESVCKEEDTRGINGLVRDLVKLYS